MNYVFNTGELNWDRKKKKREEDEERRKVKQ